MCRTLNARTLERREKMLRRNDRQARQNKAAAVFATSATFLMASARTAFADSGRHLGDMSYFSETIVLIMTLLQAVGICFMAFGIISLALAFQSHDDSQRSKAMLAIMGGCVVTCAKFVALRIAPEAATWIH